MREYRTYQRHNLDWPASGTSVQIFVFATCQKSPTEWTSNRGSTATAAAMNTKNIQGKDIFEKCKIWSKPKMVNAVTTVPTTNTTNTQPTLLG